jgi:hypothetical protein
MVLLVTFVILMEINLKNLRIFRELEGEFSTIEIGNRQPLRDRHIRADTPKELAVS